jgi:outer membrane protein assembly factor BamB
MARGKIPKAATVACRLDQARPVPIDPGDTEWSGLLPLGGIVPGVHRVLFLTTMPDGRVYQTPVTLTLSAPNASTPLWTVNVAASVQGAVATDGFTVYVPTMGGDLVALDGRNGRQLWRFSTGAGLFSAPLIDGDNLIFGSEDGSVYSVDRSKGALRYKVAAGAPVLSGIARAGNVVCVPVTDGRILGLDPATGKTLWTAPGDGLYQSRPATDGKRFFVGGWDNFVRCLDAATGKEIWKTRLGRLFYFAPAIGDPSLNSEHSLLYISSNDGALHALDAQTGATRWSVPGPSLGYSGPLFLDGSVYNASLTDTGRVFAFDAVTGAPRWEATTGSVIYDSSCCAAGDDICVGSVDGTFSRIRPGDGEIVYQYHLAPGHLLASPAADAGRVYIGTLSGDVTAFAATH